MVSSVVHGYIMGSEQRCSEAIQTQDWSQVGTDWGSEATMRGYGFGGDAADAGLSI